MDPRPHTGQSGSALKAHNRRAVLRTLLRYGPVSRVQIAEHTGLSSTTVTNLVAALLAQGVVAEADLAAQPAGERGVGRPRTALRLVPGARRVIGVHIGVGQVRVAVCDLLGCPLHTRVLEHAPEQPADQVLDAIAALVEDVIARDGAGRAALVGVGVGASGLVDPASGVNILAPNLGWRDVPLRDRLAERLRLPVCVDNNVRGMALAEALFGAGQDVGVLAFVYARVGVGAGFVVDGRVYRGGAGAGEIGHVTLLADGGEPCRCGSTGCLETLVSEAAFARRAAALVARDPQGTLARHLADADRPLMQRIFDAAREGDPATLDLLNERARYMGLGLANLVNTLSPELIILGGLFAEGADVLFGAVRETLRRHAFAGLGERVRLIPPTFGDDAGIVGAAALALDAFFYEVNEGTL